MSGNSSTEHHPSSCPPRLVTKKLSAACQSVSEGLGEERYVAVVAKGTLRPAAR